MRRLPALLVPALALLLSVDAPRARACAGAWGETAEPVAVASESAVIVWDAARRRQHFIRRAEFVTEAEDFGFLVPTPSRPELGEVPDDVFDRLAAQTAPEERTENDYTVLTCCTAPVTMFLLTAGADDAAVDAAPAPAVVVLDEQRVAGMDATALAANDPEALAAWLGEHGYANRPALVEWLRPYTEQGWIVTAFRYAGGDDGRVGSEAVRMSFDADTPIYPYREPNDHEPPYGRALRVYFIDAARAAGEGWDARTEHAAPLDDPALLRDLAPDAPTDGRWLTSFLDTARTRGDEDVRFGPSADASEVRRPPIVHHSEVVIPLPVELVLLGVGVFFLVRRRRRRASASD